MGDFTTPELGINFSYAVSNLHILQSCLKYDNRFYKNNKTWGIYMISDFITHIHMLWAQNLQDVGSLDDHRNLYIYMHMCTHTHTLSSPPPPTPHPISLQEILWIHCHIQQFHHTIFKTVTDSNTENLSSLAKTRPHPWIYASMKKCISHLNITKLTSPHKWAVILILLYKLVGYAVEQFVEARTALQAERSQVQLLISLLGFFTDLILVAAPWPWSWLSP